jgi:hypothetical protein
MKALLRKEWREHRWFLLGLYLAGSVMLGIAWILARSEITPLMSWQRLVAAFGPLAAVLLSNRLVMREYGAGTQLFLEALPVGRGRVLAVKWMFGWTALLLFFVPAFGLVLFCVHERVNLANGLPVAVGLRSAAWLAFLYAGAFAVALTLRLRFFVWGMLFFGGVLLNQQMRQSLAHYPPLSLVLDELVLESAIPWSWIAVATALASGFAAVACLLAFAGRGALPLVLARPLSARTRTMVAFAIAGFAGLTTLLEHRTQAPPFQLEDAVSSRGEPAVRVGWRQDVAGMPAAQLAERIAVDLATVRDWLGLGRLAQTALVADVWREPDDVGFSSASGNQVVIRAALGAPEVSVAQLQETVRVAQIIDQAPIQRFREDRDWLLWGFSGWWGGPRDAARRALLGRRAAAAGRLLKAHGMDAGAALRQVGVANELLGDCLVDALAWRAVQSLHDRLGEARFRALMRTALAGPAGDDARALFGIRSTADLLAQAGYPLDELAQSVDQALVSSATAALPALRVQVVPQAGAMAALRYRVDGLLPPGLDVRYTVLKPMDARPSTTDMQRVGGKAAGMIPATFARGTRVLVAAEAPDPDLQCPYRVGAVRVELP